MAGNLPQEVEAYLEEIVKRLTEYLQHQLVGIYLFGDGSAEHRREAGWQFIVTGEFSSKSDGAKWALQQQDCPDVVRRAILARNTGDKLPAAQARMLYDIVMTANRAKLATNI
ncbi:uncharacterized protein BO95DRAFT_517882 [Aspergillus brunneoviolaceus CBS 621.78]|uniref:Uncharacterized protein n=1 Tax=Aspergillus brunneoviolaceus CBS 621.78 TaxID=1450534 RepID=A0ACD1FX66_9EURO|nr:hypothetical protein BO95DRAFT_517882 [Aspergillus brunneoviolaceus CBS 621.78]RAH41574.1 hypothetical protein BO95DRAFT_517882 [Aspergillus brunneoviolaceus CBS 621.78]